jgi:hypothetical protein
MIWPVNDLILNADFPPLAQEHPQKLLYRTRYRALFAGRK